MPIMLATMQAPASSSGSSNPNYTGAGPTPPPSSTPPSAQAKPSAQGTPQSPSPAASEPKRSTSTVQPTRSMGVSSQSNAVVLSVWGCGFAFTTVLLLWLLHMVVHMLVRRPALEDAGFPKAERKDRYHFWAWVWVGVQFVGLVLVTLLVRSLPAVRRLLPAGNGFAHFDQILPGLAAGFLLGIVLGFVFPWGKHIRNKLGAND